MSEGYYMNQMSLFVGLPDLHLVMYGLSDVEAAIDSG